MPHRAAFTLVEVLVALVILALAVAALGTTLSADRHLRATAGAREAAGDALREHLEVFAAHCGAADTSGSSVGAWGTERWRATAAADGWSLTDSVRSVAGLTTLSAAAVIACRP